MVMLEIGKCVRRDLNRVLCVKAYKLAFGKPLRRVPTSPRHGIICSIKTQCACWIASSDDKIKKSGTLLSLVHIQAETYSINVRLYEI